VIAYCCHHKPRCIRNAIYFFPVLQRLQAFEDILAIAKAYRKESARRVNYRESRRCLMRTDAFYSRLRTGRRGWAIAARRLAPLMPSIRFVAVAAVLLISRRVRHTIPPRWCPEIADDKHRAKLPENQPNVALSRQTGQVNEWLGVCFSM
jgi:hypothetical protein